MHYCFTSRCCSEKQCSIWSGEGSYLPGWCRLQWNRAPARQLLQPWGWCAQLSSLWGCWSGVQRL